MDYLKCNNCGHLNKIKTEYLTFCTDCNKKLDNNFSDWNNRNPEKTFEEFKKVVCISEEDINNAKSQKKKTNKKGLKYYIGLIISIVIFSVAGKFGGEAIYGLFNNNSFDKVMMAAASEINESCPFMVDSETRLDNSIALPKNVFQYNYTLVNLLKETLDIVSLIDQIEPSIINHVKTNPDMKFLRDNNATINYYYEDKEGVYLFTVSVTPDQYEE